MIKYLLGIVLGLTPLLSEAQTGSDVDDLLTLLESTDHLQGSFLQRQYGHDNTLLAESTGTFRLLRPGYFAWEIVTPDAQLIIANPDYIWHYDRDLETVTRRPVAGDAQMTPLQVLGGDDDALRASFTVERQAAGSFVLTPHSPDVGFKQLTLHLKNSHLSGMEIRDNLDQRVEIMFSDVNSEVELSPADFAFTPPEGVDLFYYDQ